MEMEMQHANEDVRAQVTNIVYSGDRIIYTETDGTCLGTEGLACLLIKPLTFFLIQVHLPNSTPG